MTRSIFDRKNFTPEQGNLAMVEKLKQLPYLKYGTPREEVEAEIMARFRGEN